MKFTCEKATLSEGTAKASRAVATKNAVTALEGILLQCQDNKLTLTSFNMEIGIITSIPVNCLQEGTLLINSRLFTDIIHRLPDEMVIIEELNPGQVSISCGTTEFTVPSIDYSEFPELPVISDSTEFSISQEALKNCITKTIFSVAQNDTKPILTGLCFHIENQALTTVAIDNFRLALKEENILSQESDIHMEFVLPGNTAREMEKLLQENSQPVTVRKAEQYISFQTEDTTVISRLMEGQYYNFSTYIPPKGPIEITVDRKRLSDGVDRVALLINERIRNYVRISLKGERLILDSLSALGMAKDEIPLENSYEPFAIGINSRILQDAVKACDSEKITLNFTNPLRPCVVTPEGDEKYIQVLMPVRLRND